MLAIIYYDGHCPFCSNYVRLLALQKNVDVKLVNLRQEPSTKKDFLERGYDVDQGMMLDLDGVLYFGSEALHVLSQLSTASSIFNKINIMIFSRPALAAFVYPVMRFGRNTVLSLIGRAPLNEREVNPLLILFSFCWGMFSFLHFLVYAFDFHEELYLSTYMIPALGVFLMLRPKATKVLFFTFFVMAVDSIFHMPSHSNHTIIKNFFLLAVIASFLGGCVTQKNLTEVFFDAIPVGRSLLLTMYIYGVFHKINSDFLNASVSCAVSLWRKIPVLGVHFNEVWIHKVAIYGTFFVESLIFLLLLSSRGRKWGVFLGVMFHSFLALSNYAMYAAFSMLSLLLHVLFLSPATASKVVSSGISESCSKYLSLWRGKFVFLCYFLALFLYAHAGAYAVVSVLWLLVVAPLTLMVLRSSEKVDGAGIKELVWSRAIFLNLISVAFFVNCALPYFGLKTAQSVNMFANLSLEGGRSNHLILSDAPGPFGYLEDLITIESYSSSAYLNYIYSSGLKITYYDFLSVLEENHSVVVSYSRSGEHFEDVSAKTLQKDLEEVLHPPWFRKWFHFSPVDVSSPKQCAIDR